MDNPAETLAQKLRHEFELTWRESVELEAAINNALSDGAKIEVIETLLQDVFQNIRV
jgi:hypothetical protein